MSDPIRFGGLFSRELFRRSVILQGGRVPPAFHGLALVAAAGLAYLARGEGGELRVIPLVLLGAVLLLEGAVLAAIRWLPDILWSRTAGRQPEGELRVVGELGEDGLVIESGEGAERGWDSFASHTASDNTLLLTDAEGGPMPLFREHFAGEAEWRTALELVAAKLPHRERPGSRRIPGGLLAAAWLITFLLVLWLLSS